MINENINIKNSEKKDEYIVIKELLTNREKIYQYQLSGIQNGIVNFCQNYNMFQGKSNFFNLTIMEQFEFNECIEYSGDKIKKDFKLMEDFFVKCKSQCLKTYHFKAEEIQDRTIQFVDS